jgi:hypothetical protein
MRLYVSPIARYCIAEKIIDVIQILQREETKGYYTHGLVSAIKLNEVILDHNLTGSQAHNLTLSVVKELEYVTKNHSEQGIYANMQEKTHAWFIRNYNTNNKYFDEKHQKLRLLFIWTVFKSRETGKAEYANLEKKIQEQLNAHYTTRPEGFDVVVKPKVEPVIEKVIQQVTETLPVKELSTLIQQIVSEELRKIFSELKLSISL